LSGGASEAFDKAPDRGLPGSPLLIGVHPSVSLTMCTGATRTVSIGAASGPTRCVAREGFLLARIGNDVRQLATGHLWLHRNGMDALTRRRLEDHFDGGSIHPSGAVEPVANYRAD